MRLIIPPYSRWRDQRRFAALISWASAFVGALTVIVKLGRSWLSLGKKTVDFQGIKVASKSLGIQLATWKQIDRIPTPDVPQLQRTAICVTVMVTASGRSVGGRVMAKQEAIEVTVTGQD